MRSPYAGGPNTPIASAKRPRPNGPNSPMPKLDYSAALGDAEKENDTGASSSVMSPMKTSNGYKPSAGAEPKVQDEAKWKGHLGSLFSPVLKMFGTEDDAAGAAAAQAERQRLAEAAAEAQRVAEEEERQRQLQQEEEDEDDYEEFNPYLFIKQLPPHHTVRGNGPPAPRLPPKRMSRHSNPVTLVLDLDETLVHCSVDGGSAADLVFPVNFNGVTYQVGVKMRPHMEAFLRKVSERFEVVVFTASQQVYADTLLDIIDPKRELIKHRLFRDSCTLVEGNYLKDLEVLGRDLATTVLVDNSPHAFGYQVDNGIPIESWFDDPNDSELLKLATFLDTIEHAEDVRPIVRRHFKTHELIENAR